MYLKDYSIMQKCCIWKRTTFYCKTIV